MEGYKIALTQMLTKDLEHTRRILEEVITEGATTTLIIDELSKKVDLINIEIKKRDELN